MILSAGILDTLKQAGAQLIVKDLPAAVQKTVESKVASVATPIIEQRAAAKASAAVSKGNVALFAGGGVLLGVLLAGGSWRRRTVGGVVLGGLGALAGFKIGLLTDALS